jgi:hypothetical protein
MTTYEKTTRPHLFVTYCAIEGVFVWTACLVMLRHAWAKKPNWPEMFKSNAFWVGVALISVGNIIFWLGISK